MISSRCLMAAALAVLIAVPAAADPIADFYRGKTITMLIGYETGGGYDTYARAVARHIVKHIPGNPRSVPQNMVGASSMVLGNHLAKVAPRDGTVMGAINSALLFDPIFSGAETKAQFKGTEMTTIGNVVSSASVLIAWKTTGITRFEDLYSKELVIGATARTGDTYILPHAIRKVLDLKNLKITPGYPGTREVAIALERGEITGRVWDIEGIRAGRPQWLSDGSISLLVQIAPQKMPEVPAHVPLVKEFVKSPDDVKVLDTIFISTTLARPYVAPPGLPPERIRALRDAFMATMKDEEFLADMAKVKMSVAPTSGEEMERAVKAAYDMPQALKDKVQALLRD